MNETNLNKTTESTEPVQIIGLDIGRGYVKAYSEFNNNKKECIFQSIVSDGRDNLEYENYEEPIYIEFEGEKLFAGNIALKEGYTKNSNSRDSKVTPTVRKLMAVALSKVAVAKNVKIMMGVPYKIYNKETLDEVIKEYKDNVFKIEDKINGGVKEIRIVDISLFREADSALFHALNGIPNKTKDVGLVSVGFRSIELAYYSKGFKFNDRYSTTIDRGNRDVLDSVSDAIRRETGISKEVEEIDSSDDYAELKARGYRNMSEQLSQEIEIAWKNLNEMDIYISGGTSLYMTFDKRFKVLEDSQMATAKGLYEVAEFRSRKGKF